MTHTPSGAHRAPHSWIRQRSGTEPVTARSPLGLRMLLSSVFAPIFAAGAALLWLWTVNSGPHSVPTEGSLRVLAIVCTVLAVLALVDLVVVTVRRRTGREPGRERPER
ncbi:DUF6343 family protein [Streptomyces xiaopingdaonensis]|uniref:DUF6343 family protein n=1 Tax=Streptomyces xiaopingdaonensis TaxID=1565415 RepID=UPI000527DA6E|nr:DUF6343 family protein [Streptomyces xiaopingdaonensis]